MWSHRYALGPALAVCLSETQHTWDSNSVRISDLVVLLTIAIVGLMWGVRKELKLKGDLVCGHAMNLSMRYLNMALSILTPYCMMPRGLKDPPS